MANKLVFTMIGDQTRFAFRFGNRGGHWFHFLSINNTEFRMNKINYTEVTNKRLRKVYANFCRRMKMEGKE